jgi:uncharacterized membrane-anchored protein YjiN (DUF445 family)
MPVSPIISDVLSINDLRPRKEFAVSIEEIVHTCSNEKVAQAAVASLGSDFATRVRTEAERHGTSMGTLVAKIVREFGEIADATERKAVCRAMHNTDQPILSGLRFILEGRLRIVDAQSSGGWPIGNLSRSRPDLSLRPLV